MRKSLIVLLVVAALAGVGVVMFSSPTGMSVAGMDFGGHERAWLRDRSIDFLEDLQFKDFDTASTYHLPETQEARNIPDLIRRVFGIRHEVLDIIRYEVAEVDLDRSKTRARVRCFVDFRTMGHKKIRESVHAQANIELMLYWFRGEDGKWTMELESSLR